MSYPCSLMQKKHEATASKVQHLIISEIFLPNNRYDLSTTLVYSEGAGYGHKLLTLLVEPTLLGA